VLRTAARVGRRCSCGLPLRRAGRHDELRRHQSTIAPTKALLYGTNDLAIEALGNRTSTVSSSTPTADYATNVQVENAVIVGQFDGRTPEYISSPHQDIR
jgi:hypothetical protein